MPDSVANKGIDSAVAWLNKNKTHDYDGYKFVSKNGNLQLVED
ncbi:hypothetical protein [Staphylococcus agnetis]|nr:hypothetical protein [Staphylococcus agnetis]